MATVYDLRLPVNGGFTFSGGKFRTLEEAILAADADQEPAYVREVTTRVVYRNAAAKAARN